MTDGPFSSYTFTVPGSPKAKARARGGKFGHYTPKETVAAEGNVGDAFMRLRDSMSEAARSQVPIQHDGPVRLTVICEFLVPKSWPRWKREAALEGKLRHESKPDADNLIKLVKDALNGLAWVDDSSVYDERCVKHYSDTARTTVIVQLYRRYERP